MRELVGRTFGHYRVIERLGAGGMGLVYRAHEERLDRDVAAKVLPGEVAHDPARLARSAREAKAVAGLDHPNVLATHDFGFLLLFAIDDSRAVAVSQMGGSAA